MDKRLWYNKEAAAWVEALPLGNGRIGAMAFSGVAYDKIQINEETLWSGYPDKHTKKHSMDEVYKIRELVKQGKYKEAHKSTSETMFNVTSDAYLSYGHIYIDTVKADWGNMKTPHPEDYIRELDLETGVVKASHTLREDYVTKELFVSLKDDVLVMHIKNSKPQIFHIHQAIDLENKIESRDGIMKVTGRCPSMPGVRNDAYDDNETIHFCSMMSVIGDGRIQCVGNNWFAWDCTDVTLFFTIKTSFNGFDKMPVSEGKEYESSCRNTLDKAMKYSFEELKERHIAEYKKYFDRVSLKIDGEDYSNEPTDERIEKAGEGRVDNGLVSLLFDYGRYLAICASQENTQPMNLQGIWNNITAPLWNCNYTMNINTQMNYWAVETCNLPECHMPALKMLKEFAEKGNNFGLRGWSSWHNSDIWRFNYEATNYVLWGYWQMGGFWLCRHIWEHYLHTRDVEFLKEYYPVLTGAAEFLEDWMFENEYGYLTTCPSTSPENEFYIDGERCGVCEGSAMDMSIIYDLFDKTIKAAEVLGEDNEHLKEILSKLKPVLIGDDGRILEWGKDFEETELYHRHISHLYGIFPSDIWADGKYNDAARESLRVRLESGGGGTGWSNAWIANIYARLKDGKGVMNHIRYMFKKSMYANMLDAHPPFQIDGNFGICSAICEALMQSHTGRVELIPAIPDEWKSGEVRGFIARTGEVVNFKWKDGSAERF